MRPIDADKIVLNYGGLTHISPLDGRAIAKYFYDQIQAMPTIDPPPNDPLTPEELREMEGKPVWCASRRGESRWGIVHVYGDGRYEFECYTTEYGRIPGWCYGMKDDTGWLAYRRKLEEK